MRWSVKWQLVGRAGAGLLLVAALALGPALLSPASSAAAPNGPLFTDIGEAGMHQRAVQALADLGVLTGTGCDPERLCPREPLKRWTMAVWVARARQLPGLESARGSRFADVDAHLWWSRHVEVFAEAGITMGCATHPRRYCPHENVTRAQMASFLVRTFDLDPAVSAGFVDVGTNAHAANVDSLFASGITAGCGTGPLRYCPDQPVTKAQMATFLARALDLALDLVGRPGSSGSPEPLTAPELAKIDAAVELIQQHRSDTLRLNADGVLDCPPQGTPTGSPDDVEVLRIVDGCLIVAYERLNGRTLDEFAQQSASDPTVLSVDRPATVEVSYAVQSSDPRSREQWFLAKLDARALWDGWPEDAEVRVAVLDTGVDGSHRDLAANVLPGKGRSPGQGNDDGRTDTNGHGTHVAGIIAAVADNSLDGAGMAPQARIVPIKVNLGGNPSDTSIPDGIGYATGAIAYSVNLRADIISMSFGSWRPWEAVRMALEVGHRLGIVAVAAAGNDSEDAAGNYPAGYDTVMSVAATGPSGSLADFSNYGNDVVAAPGKDILSTVPSGMAVYSGTSMAAPMVSAVAAHLKARFPDATAERDQGRNRTISGAATRRGPQPVRPRPHSPAGRHRVPHRSGPAAGSGERVGDRRRQRDHAGLVGACQWNDDRPVATSRRLAVQTAELRRRRDRHDPDVGAGGVAHGRGAGLRQWFVRRLGRSDRSCDRERDCARRGDGESQRSGKPDRSELVSERVGHVVGGRGRGPVGRSVAHGDQLHMDRRAGRRLHDPGSGLQLVGVRSVGPDAGDCQLATRPGDRDRRWWHGPDDGVLVRPRLRWSGRLLDRR